MIIQQFLLWKDSADVARRKSAATALGRAYLSSQLSFEDHCAAEAALTLLLDDPSEKVRLALAETLASSAHAPVQIIHALTRDQFEIASLVIARSPIVADSDLAARVQVAPDDLQIVIAERPHVSRKLALAISKFACAEACVVLLNNFNAAVCTDCRNLIVERHVGVARVRGALLRNKNLEAELRLKVLKAAGTALSASNLFGARKENGASGIIVRDAEQCALVHMAGRAVGKAAETFIDALRDSGDLTTQLLIRAACHGKMDFLARVIASLSGQSSQRVTSILVNERSTQLRALISDAGFSATVAPVFELAVSHWRDVAQGRLEAGAQEVTRLIMEQYQSQADSSFSAANDDIVALLRAIYLDAMRDNARRHAASIAQAA